MKNLQKNIPSGLIKKACRHLKNVEQHLLNSNFLLDDWLKIEKIEKKYESIKRSN